MKLTKPIFTLNPTAFQVYCYLWKKLEALPSEAQTRRIVTCSKSELTTELNHSINTIRQALDVELEMRSSVNPATRFGLMAATQFGARRPPLSERSDVASRLS